MATTVPSRHRLRRDLLRCVVSLAAIAIAFTVDVDAAQYDTIDGYDCFRSLEGMTKSMFDLAESYPDLSSVVDIGDSYLKSKNDNNDDYPLPQNGYDIYAMVITASDSPHPSSAKGKTLIISGVHPREYAPPELTMRFAESLLSNYQSDADITYILDHTEVHIIFQVNPDSRYITEKYPKTFWRKNQNPDNGRGNCKADEIGVDLNRNFGFRWGDQDGASDDRCDSTYHGRGPGSEPETRAVVDYAKEIFPEEQGRRDDPEGSMNVAFGEDNTGIFVDVHAPGGYIFYPWGHKDRQSPDDDALQATARKMSYYNGYVLWAGGQPDFQYAASGDSSDYMYAALGVASFGLELGEDFYENCNLFERKVLPDNISALTYLAKNAKKPFSLPKGPDIISLDLSDDGTTQDGVQYGIKVTTVASDSRLVNSISGYPDFTETGSQGVSEVRVYLDVHPDDFKEGDDLTWEMQLIDNDSEEPKFELEVISAEGFSSGRHTLYVQAKDRDGYFGPATGAFFDVEIRPTKSPSLAPTTDSPSLKPTSTPTRRPSKKPSASPTTATPSALPTGKPSTSRPTKSPSRSPVTANPSLSPTGNPTRAPSYSPTTAQPSASPTTNPTKSPSASPTYGPSRNPSKSPTGQPTASPSDSPSTSNPTSQPSTAPSFNPSTKPSFYPSLSPSINLSGDPSYQPSDDPTVEPALGPNLSQNANPQPNLLAPTSSDSAEELTPPSTSEAQVTETLRSENASTTTCLSAAVLALSASALSLLYLD
eukprot:CAMPEP_0201634714 /NCGR_PEP_ID=MMETSP0493-20130528/7532_1 /ASSEMBLY_ACC=CAM_ASM_000838 /TAXON_ID=420259 /ORGANISM="Thalassiosira gravida, Strain GMp14c1" /LENGTH=763 /DNA_ID=CAMNT_0048106595 /DNA_START=92 /DNA_END=2383 /DNA_ORIENTATION=+